MVIFGNNPLILEIGIWLGAAINDLFGGIVYLVEMRSMTKGQVYYLNEVLGLKSVIRPEAIEVFVEEPREVSVPSYDLMFVIPEGLSSAARSLLHKIEFAVAPLKIRVEEVHRKKFSSMVLPQTLIAFGEECFVDLGLSRESFLDHLQNPAEHMGVQVYASHDLEDMAGRGAEVPLLKKQVWHQLKDIKKRLSL